MPVTEYDLDKLRATIWNSVASQDATVFGHVLQGRKIAPFSEENIFGSDITTDYSGVAKKFSIPRGKLLDLAIMRKEASQRGQTLIRIEGMSGPQIIDGVLLDYLYTGNVPRAPPVYHIDPLSGRGHLDWIQLSDDSPGNANVTSPLSATNTRRIIHGVVLNYNADANSSTRAIELRIRQLGATSYPTGFGAVTSEKAWASPVLTLTLSEEGTIYVGKENYIIVNDNGSISYADHTTSPHPFPLLVEQGDTVDLQVIVSSGLAGDDFDLWVLREEWIVP